MTDLSMHLHDLASKEAEQAKIDKDKEAFFAKGGKVTVVPSSEYERDPGISMREQVTLQADEAKARRGIAA